MFGTCSETLHRRSLRHRLARGVAGFACLLWAAASAQAAAPGAQTAAVQDAPQELVRAAQAEGELTLYASVSETQIKVLLAAFEKEYGIRSTYLRLVSVPLIQRFATENAAAKNDADVFFDSSPEAFERYPQWFLSIDSAAVPGIARWPSRWVGGKHVTLQTSPFVIQYNTQQVAASEVPKTWQQVLDSAWKGRIVLTDPRVSNIYMGWLDAMERHFGAGFLRKLGAQQLKLAQSGAAGAQMVAAGAYALNFPAYATFAIPLIEKKAPIASQVLEQPVLVNETSVGLPSGARHPNAARLFVSWLLSERSLRTACASFPIATPGDPDGKFGCVAVKDPQPVNRSVDDARRQFLLRELGLTQH